MKQTSDKQRSFRDFQVGDKVFLKLQPYAQQSVVNHPYLSIQILWSLHYSRKDWLCSISVGIARKQSGSPDLSCISIETFTIDYTHVFSTLPSPVELDVSELLPDEILDRRLVKKGNDAHLQILIKWNSLPVTMATWEDYNVLKKCFMNASTWGQARSQGGGNVTTTVATMTRIEEGQEEMKAGIQGAPSAKREVKIA